MTDDATRAERHMSDTEALMWNLEKDPMLRSAFANITVLDCPPDLDRLRHRMAEVARVFPRLRRKVAPTFGRLAPPRWVDDTDFDISHHVRRVALPAPGGDRELLDLASQVTEDPFDRTRPLWRFWIVEGLSGGRGAIVQQMHHTITDGEGGVRLSAMILDLERDATQPILPIPPAGDDDEGDSTASTPGSGPIAGTKEALEHNLRRQYGVARRIVEGSIDTLRHPGSIPTLAGDVLETARSVGRQAFSSDGARSPLWTDRSLTRHIETLRVPLAEAKTAASELGGTINDLFVTAAAAAAGAYHRRFDAPVDELRISMPVSIRTKGSSGGNAFTPTRLLVPTGELDPRERFARTHELLRTTRGERAITAAASLAGVLNLLPTSVLVGVGRRQVDTIDFAVSNVRGAPFDMYLGGGKVTANYPIGPTAGTAFNLTLLSSSGMLDMGLNCDLAAVGDPEALRDELELAFEELMAASR